MKEIKIPIEMESKERDELKIKRTNVLIGVWNYITQNKLINGNRFKLSMPLVNDMIEHYITDIEILKYRYKIDKRIQLPKVAGLLTYLILKFRPVIPLFDVYQSDKEIYVNEIFAVIHGLAICGEYESPEQIKNIMKENWFDAWLNDFLYLLHYRHYTSESLIFIYETLSFFKYPKNVL